MSWGCFGGVLGVFCGCFVMFWDVLDVSRSFWMCWDVLGQFRTFCYVLVCFRGCFGGVLGHFRIFWYVLICLRTYWDLFCVFLEVFGCYWHVLENWNNLGSFGTFWDISRCFGMFLDLS